MVVKPEIRSFVCLTAHPQGCAARIREQIDLVRGNESIHGPIKGPRKALVIGASTGYGLASRIAAAFGTGADTFGVFKEKPPTRQKTASAGWYNTAAFETEARRRGLGAWSLNTDAFSSESKQEVIDLVRKTLGPVDLVVYSLAAPRRTDPNSGETFQSALKPVGRSHRSKTVDINQGTVFETVVEPATEEEIRATVKVMGGEDWALWITALREAGLLAPGVLTLAYSYIGPEVTKAIYRQGTIGRAKEHLEATVSSLGAALADLGGRAYVSVNKALVTQASSAIPLVPLYISLLYRIMKERGTHEGCIEQMERLFREKLYTGSTVPTDSAGLIRMDDWEMEPQVQQEVVRRWKAVST